MKRLAIAFVFTVSIGSENAHAQALTDDLSRADLNAFAMAEYDEFRAFSRLFVYPVDVVADRVFGIDVSHHQGKIDWEGIGGNGVSFVYMKATQGKTFFDPRFNENWKAIETLRSGGIDISRGAYHFFSATTSAKDQAENYLSRVGELEDTDLVPCLDLEWDFRFRQGQWVTGTNGEKLDHWSLKDPAEIVARAKEWLTIVEETTGKKPIIYTNGFWWRERIGAAGSELSDYDMWIADYSWGSLAAEQPRFVPDGHSWALWQFTDRSMIQDVLNGVDSNVSSLSKEDFLEMMRGG